MNPFTKDLSAKWTWARVELGRRINRHRFAHSLSVAWAAQDLARLHGIDPNRAALAGLLHDCARDMSASELLGIARSQGFAMGSTERDVPVLLHGQVGAYLARSVFGVTDCDVLQAIAFHPTGAPELKPVAKTLYVADYVEARRCFPGVEAARALARVDLEAAIDYKLVETGKYLRSRALPLHPLFREMLQARNLAKLVVGVGGETADGINGNKETEDAPL